MEPLPRLAQADWSSRMMAILSLVVAIGAIIYATRKSPDATANSFDTEMVSGKLEQLLEEKHGQFEKRIEDLSKQFDSQLQQARTKLGGDMRNEISILLTDYDTRMERRNTQLNAAIREFETDATERLKQFDQTATLILNKPSNSGEKDGTDTTGDVASTDTGPRLSLPELLMRPAGTAFSVVRIKNDGDEDARIDRIRFKPVSTFKIDASTDSDQEGIEASDSVQTFAFASSNNQSDKPGHHGIYDRTLTDALQVPAGGELNVRIVIQDPTYTGWGFAGKLVLEYNDQQTLMVPMARVRFQKETMSEVESNKEIAGESET